MKTCIIAIVRQENLYIKEWVDYHLNLGFDNIIICDNNDTDERVSDVIKDNRVIILDYINIENIQSPAYTECFLKYKNNYNWLSFIDIDEFIMLDKKYHNNIKEFLNDSIFKNVDIIRLCQKIYTSNTLFDIVDNYSVLNRFKDQYISGEEAFCKSIIRGTVEYVGGVFQARGYYKNAKVITVSSDGNYCMNSGRSLFFPKQLNTPPIYTNAWINHYPTKTIGEYIRQKYFRGGPNANCRKYNNLNYFFKYNIQTAEKEEYAKKLIKELSKTMIKEKYLKLYKI